MTYLTFLLVFLVLPIVLLGMIQRRPLAGVGGKRARYTLPLVAGIAFFYTTPWDNYLVFRNVWRYGADRVVGTLGYVPYEEYVFFVLQPILTGLFLYYILSAGPRRMIRYSTRQCVVGGVFWMTITGIGVAFLITQWAPGRYLGLILAWAAPVLAAMWAYAGPLFAAYSRPAAIAAAVPTVYLWVADRLAIGLGIWDISDAYSLGLEPLGLPIEEAIFFLITNLLVVCGCLLFLFGDTLEQARQAQSTLPATAASPERSL